MYQSAVNEKPLTANYYIGNINQTVTADMIAAHLHYYNVYIVSLRVFESKRTGLNAAKLSIPMNHACILDSPHFWPEGVYARIWHD